jgi:hypothetical protein
MRAISFAIVLIASFAASAARQSTPRETATSDGQSKSGTVCVLPNSTEPPSRTSPGGMYNPATLTVSVDKGKPILWPHQQPVRIENLSLEERHLVVLASDGKRIHSFRFRFADYKQSRLCLYFDGYQGVQLGNGANALWCKCR